MPSHRPHGRLIHNDLPTPNDAPHPPKTEQASPTAATIEMQAGDIVSGDADGQEVAPIDAGLR